MSHVSTKTITSDSALWPSQLADLGEDQPHELFLLGSRLDLLTRDFDDLVVITGSRASTTYGDAVATDIAQDLSDHRVIITGGGYGIDAVALRAALAAHAAPIVVLASGLDQLYPAGNRDLLEQVAAHGLIITENDLGTPPTRDRFLRRSRILAALAGTTVAVEAARRSGVRSVVTQAYRLDRRVAAVPGPVTSAASAGTNAWIADRTAQLVTDAADIDALISFG